MKSMLKVKSAAECQWDLISLGEVMLRLDPGVGRIHTARSFEAWEGGGEYNVARGLRRCFGKRTAILTALADNPIGRLLEDLMLQGGTDTSLVKWVAYDGVGRTVRNGLNFTERGFGPRPAVGCSDRGHSAASQLEPDDFDWQHIFTDLGSRWLHCGGIFAALSDTTPAVAARAFEMAKRSGTVVSYDLNYRDSLWRTIGGQANACKVNRELVGCVDVLFGNEEDFSAALGFEIEGVDSTYSELRTDSFRRMIEKVVAAYPNIKAVATTLRTAKTAGLNGWGAIGYCSGEFFEVTPTDVEIFDRVGGGDSFASGYIYGLLEGKDPLWSMHCGTAHGALAMSTPGDTSMASRSEVERLMKGSGSRIQR
jgi:2-dehydro-3-deoxygluconokinase